jgi:predicted secreted protein
MRRIPALLGPLALCVMLAAPLAAQPTPVAETELHIGESAEVARAPDEVVATLRAEARAGTAGAAQEAVNRAIAAAVARAQAVPGLRVSTGGYWTSRVDEGRAWQAAQQVTLRSGNAAALLDLVGTLQGQGLAMSGLHWQLTRETERAAREEASRLALDGVRRRAAAVAEQLGLVLVGLKEVRIDVPERMPRPMPMAMAARSASAAPAPPPVAVAEDVPVQATVQAVAVLRPR